MTSRITYVYRPASSPRLYGCLAFRCYCHCWNGCCNTSVPKQPRSLRLTDDITVSMPRSSLTANARKHCENIQLTSVCTHITFIMLPCVKQVIYSTPAICKNLCSPGSKFWLFCGLFPVLVSCLLIIFRVKRFQRLVSKLTKKLANC